jgi:inorganic pyrophosphatase
MSEFDWSEWERRIVDHGVTLDRPRGSRHPRHPEIVYPIDYGYVNDTVSTDGDEVDVFVGTGDTGLVGVIHTRDHRKGDEEMKLLWNCTPVEVYVVNGFINYDRNLMDGILEMRRPLETYWAF